jgi:DNA invertase Pin-like site-specific DNA recombinase
MANFAYLRISTDNQDVKKFGLLDYCHSKNIAPLEFIEDTASGTTAWCERATERLLEM